MDVIYVYAIQTHGPLIYVYMTQTHGHDICVYDSDSWTYGIYVYMCTHVCMCNMYGRYPGFDLHFPQDVIQTRPRLFAKSRTSVYTCVYACVCVYDVRLFMHMHM